VIVTQLGFVLDSERVCCVYDCSLVCPVFGCGCWVFVLFVLSRWCGWFLWGFCLGWVGWLVSWRGWLVCLFVGKVEWLCCVVLCCVCCVLVGLVGWLDGLVGWYVCC